MVQADDVMSWLKRRLKATRAIAAALEAGREAVWGDAVENTRLPRLCPGKVKWDLRVAERREE